MGEVAAGASDEKVIATAIHEGAVLLPPLRRTYRSPTVACSSRNKLHASQ